MERHMKIAEQWAVRILCALALLFVGFAHQVPERVSTGLDLSKFAEYILPDGTLPSLCITVKEGDSQKHHKSASSNCEACRISASVLLPVPADVDGSHIEFITRTERPTYSEGFYRQLYPPNTGPRAPPSDPILI